MPRIGDLTDNLSFQAPSGTPVSWTTIFSCKGQHKGLTSKEGIAAMAGSSIITGTVKIRWRPVRIRSNWRIVVNGYTTLNVIGPAIDTRLPEGRFLVMKVAEVA